jgi:WD40 repeat protein
MVFAQNEPSSIEAVVQMGHSQFIKCSDYSPDGKYLLTGSGDNSILLWDIKSQKQLRTYNPHSKPIKSLNFSQNGKYFLSTSKDNTIKLVDVLTGQVKQDYKINRATVSNGYFSQNDTYVVVLSNRDKYFIYETLTGKLKGVFFKDNGAFNEKNLIDPLETKALSKINNKLVACIQLNSNDTLFTFPFDKAFTMGFSPNGKQIVVGSSKLFSQVFDAETGRLLHTLKSDNELGCDGCSTALTISPNNKYVFTMSSKLDGILWDLKSGKKLAKYGSIKSRPDNIVFSNDEKYLLLLFDEHLQIYNLKTTQKILDVTNKWIEYYEFKFHPILNQIILPSKNNTVIIWDADKHKKVKTFKGYLNQDRTDGLNYDYISYYDQNILNYISLKSNVSISGDDQNFLIGKIDTSALLINIKTGRIKKRFTNSKISLTQCFSKNNKWLAIAGGDKMIRVYDVSTNQLKYVLKGHGAIIFDLQFSSDNQTLISGSWDGSVLVWDFKNESVLKRIDITNASPYIVRYSPNDLYILSGDVVNHLDFWEVDTQDKFRSLVGHTQTISGIDFSDDNQLMATSSWDGHVKIWNVLTGMITAKMGQKNNPVYAVKWVDDKILSGGADRLIHVWDKNGKSITTLNGHSAGVTDIEITSDHKYLVSRARNGEVIVWDYVQQKPLYTYIQINSNDWLVKTESGYFDGSPKALNLVNYVSGFDVISVNSLFKKYYTPNLIERIMQGEYLDDSGTNMHQMMQQKPQLDILLSEAQSRGGIVDDDSIYTSKSKLFKVNVVLYDNGKNIKEIRLYNNGKLLDNETYKQDISFRGDKNIKPFNVELVSGINKITAIAVNLNQVESDPVSVSVTYDSESSNSDLYIFTIGINNYKNTNYQLNYAVKDAKDFSHSINQKAEELFDHVYVNELYNDKATKTSIIEQFKTLQTQIDAEDVLVFYYAGHGVMSQNINPDFYLVTYALTNLYGSQALLDKEGVSATELLAFSKNIKAQKQLFILDACHSGGAINTIASRGASREKAIAQLARNTGTFFLTASQDAQYANESGDLKHGLFTYALLEVLTGKDTASSTDGKITINEIKTYVDERVPELSEKYHGSAQYPTSYSFGQDFPIVILK